MANIPNGTPSTDQNGAVLTKSVPQTGNLIPNGRPSVDENGALLIIGPGSGTGTPTPYTVQVPRAVVNSPSDIFQYFFMYASTLDIANSYWNTGGAPGALELPL
ncbi:hypothetical protein [Burkholderia cenocepacia]|uniref:hypothetical protein n=1 Tax=Burkholderia cenocepacia TaxID=95486 RepID=UPI000980D039|nr:hypothetical protein [Burkholderia cenocepacia]ONJ33937.1 hypothetical protein A8F38_07460 [Burkholderia cenocepacia]ONY73383.1 hypothetical protein A8F35_15945 [Burkholderia cenocepacia]ONY77606.1 hypothetical protein A8F36_19540 [Burkholderia cenocepacia]ONY80987.1 hypothetical protein A8F37_18665 [Burkholderia cenocepacia]ONZ00623.1 hypothetical protein A8F34_17340 [Burkholderia cenocepacia]